MDAWLESAGLGHLIPAFTAQKIGVENLVDLTEEDLREMGIAIGDRKTLRRAILARQGVRPTVTERRPLSVMFIDMVGYSKIADQVDPEDLEALVERYIDFCGAVIARYGGQIFRLVGDGILAGFCHPVANENDPERATRAAVDIVAGIGSLTTPFGSPVAVRIGIATGRVLIKDLQAGGAYDRRSLFSPTANLAARLQALLKPDTGILIADETHQRVKGIFACDDLGLHTIEGFESAPRRVWRVVGPRDKSTIGPPKRLTGLFGRTAELEELGSHWRRTVAGEGSAVLLIGEAGVGKSRLVEESVRRMGAAPGQIVAFDASQFATDSPLHPVIEWLRLVSGIRPQDSASAQREKLATALGAEPNVPGDSLRILAGLLGVAPDEAAPSLAPDELREATLQAVTALLRRLGTQSPVCLIVEDAHWLDPTTLELLDRLAALLVQSRIFLLMTARPEFYADWLHPRDVLVMPVTRLPDDDIASMIRDALPEAEAARDVIDDIIRKTDGLPLFVEECVRSLAGSDVLSATRAEVPATLQELLVGRLDRSGAARPLAQTAAVIGRSVRRDVLASVADTDPAELDDQLAALVAAGVLVADTSRPGQAYAFSHALLRDAAYESLLRDPRQTLHLRAAQALRSLDPALIEQEPEVLALHLAEGGRPDEAVPFWLSAGRRSLSRSALIEATRLLQRGLAALEKLPQTPTNHSLKLRLYALLGPAVIGVKGPGSPDTQELYNRAYALSHDLPEEESHFPIYWGWWRMGRAGHVWRDRAAQLLAGARRRGDPELILQAHHCAWGSHFATGELSRCCSHIEAGLKLYAAGDFRHHAQLYGNHDTKVCAHGNLSQVLWLQGSLHQAIKHDEAATEWARQLDHLGSRVHAQDMHLLNQAYRRNFLGVYTQAGELVRLTVEYGLPDARAKGMIFRGWATAMAEEAAAGLAMLEEGFSRQRDIGTDEDFPFYLTLWSESLVVAGKADRAIEELRKGIAHFSEVGLGFWRPELHRVLGEAILAVNPDDHEGARAEFDSALREAHEQGAHMLGLRSAISAAKLDVRLGRIADAIVELTAARDAVTEDDGGFDMRNAADLLLQLRARL